MPVGKTGVDLKDFEKIDWDSLTFANNYIFLEVMNNKNWTINEFTQEIDEETKRVRNDTKWRERIVTWEMDLRIIKKRAHEKGKQEGIDIGKQEVAEALRKKGMSEAEIAEVTGLPEKKETLK